MFKYIFLISIFFHFIYADQFSWGAASKIGLTNGEVDNIIKQYVAKKYPKKVKAYHLYLKQLREKKLKAVEDLIYVKDDLVWQDDKNSTKIKLNSLDAKNYCKSLSLATKNDWRLPTYTQMLTLINYYRYEPAKVDGLNNVRNDKYWTISSDATDISANWYIDFTYGQTGTTLKYTKLNVKCVRDLSKVEGEF